MPRTKKAAVEPIAETVSETPAVETETAALAADEAKAEPKKTTRKRTVKAAEEKTEAAPKKTRGRKKATADTAAEAKEEAPETEAPKKATTRKAAAKKDAAQVSVKIQFGGRDFSTEEILEKAKAAFSAANEGVEIKTIELYVNADDRAAYYVVNGQVPENNKIDL